MEGCWQLARCDGNDVVLTTDAIQQPIKYLLFYKWRNDCQTCFGSLYISIFGIFRSFKNSICDLGKLLKVCGGEVVVSVLAVQQLIDRRNWLFTISGTPKHVGPLFPYFKGFWIGSMEFPLTIFTYIYNGYINCISVGYL